MILRGPAVETGGDAQIPGGTTTTPTDPAAPVEPTEPQDPAVPTEPAEPATPAAPDEGWTIQTPAQSGGQAPEDRAGGDASAASEGTA